MAGRKEVESCHIHDANGRRRDFAVAWSPLGGNGVVKLVPHPVAIAVAKITHTGRKRTPQDSGGVGRGEAYCRLTANR